MIPPIADPDGEEDDFGKPPAIGFNSAIKFDFNAADGIDADKLDFEAAALHEIGHALGFYSSVGVSSSVRPSVWDFFRLRPDMDMAAFGTAERILTAGGMQAFLAGREPLALSTGNPQATIGDRRQASHWKDDLLNNGNYIGIMDPTGELPGITMRSLRMTSMRSRQWAIASDQSTAFQLRNCWQTMGRSIPVSPVQVWSLLTG